MDKGGGELLHVQAWGPEFYSLELMEKNRHSSAISNSSSWRDSKDKWILGAPSSATLAEMMNFKISERPCLKK